MRLPPLLVCDICNDVEACRKYNLRLFYDRDFRYANGRPICLRHDIDFDVFYDMLHGKYDYMIRLFYDAGKLIGSLYLSRRIRLRDAINTVARAIEPRFYNIATMDDIMDFVRRKYPRTMTLLTASYTSRVANILMYIFEKTDLAGMIFDTLGERVEAGEPRHYHVLIRLLYEKYGVDIRYLPMSPFILGFETIIQFPFVYGFFESLSTILFRDVTPFYYVLGYLYGEILGDGSFHIDISDRRITSTKLFIFHDYPREDYLVEYLEKVFECFGLYTTIRKIEYGIRPEEEARRGDYYRVEVYGGRVRLRWMFYPTAYYVALRMLGLGLVDPRFGLGLIVGFYNADGELPAREIYPSGDVGIVIRQKTSRQYRIPCVAENLLYVSRILEALNIRHSLRYDKGMLCKALKEPDLESEVDYRPLLYVRLSREHVLYAVSYSPFKHFDRIKREYERLGIVVEEPIEYRVRGFETIVEGITEQRTLL